MDVVFCNSSLCRLEPRPVVVPESDKAAQSAFGLSVFGNSQGYASLAYACTNVSVFQLSAVDENGEGLLSHAVQIPVPSVPCIIEGGSARLAIPFGALSDDWIAVFGMVDLGSSVAVVRLTDQLDLASLNSSTASDGFPNVIVNSNDICPRGEISTYVQMTVDANNTFYIYMFCTDGYSGLLIAWPEDEAFENATYTFMVSNVTASLYWSLWFNADGPRLLWLNDVDHGLEWQAFVTLVTPGLNGSTLVLDGNQSSVSLGVAPSLLQEAVAGRDWFREQCHRPPDTLRGWFLL